MRAQRARPLQPGEGRERARAELGERAAYAVQAVNDKLIDHRRYVCEHGDDMPFQKRAHSPYLLAANFAKTDQAIPWPGKRRLRLVFG